MHLDIIRSADWDRVSRMTDEAIAEDITRDPDAIPFTDADGLALRIQLIRKGLSLSQAQFAAQFHSKRSSDALLQ
jgi:DNA-binding transcriptional regulator YiaG